MGRRGGLADRRTGIAGHHILEGAGIRACQRLQGEHLFHTLQSLLEILQQTDSSGRRRQPGTSRIAPRIGGKREVRWQMHALRTGLVRQTINAIGTGMKDTVGGTTGFGAVLAGHDPVALELLLATAQARDHGPGTFAGQGSVPGQLGGRGDLARHGTHCWQKRISKSARVGDGKQSRTRGASLRKEWG